MTDALDHCHELLLLLLLLSGISVYSHLSCITRVSALMIRRLRAVNL